ncbi:MAG: putative drug resistance transporter [Ilumatobacteraceae bacterium]|nr:putative drug resistance transporter [Ilumatobacteraceae bacterium]
MVRTPPEPIATTIGNRPPADAEGVADPRRRTMILVAMCVALIAVIASVSGLNVAQQQLAADIGATQSQLLWVINGYTIALAALLLPVGAIGDRWGRKHILIAGLGVFTVANLLASIASSPMQLIAFRVLGGVGAAMIMPVTLSVITSSFPEEERGRAVGIWAGVAGAGGILGLISSAILVDNFTWPWLFAGPIALAALAGVMTFRFVPHSREHVEGRFDTGGSILSALGVGGLVLGIHEGPEHGWGSSLAVAGLLVGVLAAAAFVRWELRQERPLIDLRVFSNRSLAGGSVSLLVTFAVLTGLFLAVVQFMQAVLGYSALRASVALLPMAAMMMPLSTVAPSLSQRFGLRTMLTAGSLCIAAGLAMLGIFSTVDGGYLPILPGLLVMGLGVGLSMSPGTTAITASLPAEHQGVASALNDTVREFGGALGVALMGSLLSAGYSSNIVSATVGLPTDAAATVKEGIGGAFSVAPQLGDRGPGVIEAARSAFVDGWRLSMWVAAGLLIAAAIFSAIWIPSRQRALATHLDAADELAPTAELELAIAD